MQLRRTHLRTARRAKGLTAIELAEAIGATQDQIYNVESGRTKPDHLLAARWAVALGMSFYEAFPEVFTTQDGRHGFALLDVVLGLAFTMLLIHFAVALGGAL